METEEELHQPFLSSTHDDRSSHATDSRLEEVLSDTTVPFSKRLLSATWIELKLLFPLAGPAIIVYVINNLMSFVTRAFAGHLGNLELAAANLGNSGIQLLAYGLMVNCIYGSPLPTLSSLLTNTSDYLFVLCVVIGLAGYGKCCGDFMRTSLRSK